jgi:hypothetical protein
MTLTPQDLQSATWRKLEAHLIERLSTLRAQNDGELDPLQTARLRGRIAATKELLALGKPGLTTAEADA